MTDARYEIITTQNTLDQLEIIETREGLHSTAVTSQIGPNQWYNRVKGEYMADPIPSRIATPDERLVAVG